MSQADGCNEVSGRAEKGGYRNEERWVVVNMCGDSNYGRGSRWGECHQVTLQKWSVQWRDGIVVRMVDHTHVSRIDSQGRDYFDNALLKCKCTCTAWWCERRENGCHAKNGKRAHCVGVTEDAAAGPAMSKCKYCKFRRRQDLQLI